MQYIEINAVYEMSGVYIPGIYTGIGGIYIYYIEINAVYETSGVYIGIHIYLRVGDECSLQR